MAEFPQTVQPPGGASYNAPILNFSQFANWAADDPYAQKFKSQEAQLNDARLQQMQQQIELSKSFANGLPTDANGQVDYRKAAAILASKGDIGGAVSLLQQQPPAPSPLLGGGAPQPGGQGGQPAVAPQGQQPQAIPAKPLPPPAANSPQGDSGSGSITSIVTDKLPSQNLTTGQTIMKIAEVMGVDPNADLTPGQLRRAQGLLSKYAPEIAGMSGQQKLPPSVNAVTPGASSGSAAGGTVGAAGAPTAGVSSQPSGAPAPQPQQPAGQPQQQQPAQQPQQPLVPQVPLPKGFTDPQAAIMALQTEAARYAAMPNGQAQASLLKEWAQRIEQSTAPIKMGQYDTYVSPTNPSQVLAQGPGAAALRGGAQGGASLDADAENYRQTGKLPPNMGRGVQGSAEALRIRERAAELEQEAGGNTADWPGRWQTFSTGAAGKRVLATRAVNLQLAENEASSLIPRVREASAKISRTQYPTLNSLILAAEKGSGDPNVIKYGLAVSSLIPVYARVLKPTGQITEGDTHRATEILDKAWSQGQIDAALDQMEVELSSAKQALQKTIDESSGKKAEGSQDKGTTTGKDGWTTLPNGVRIREVK